MSSTRADPPVARPSGVALLPVGLDGPTERWLRFSRPQQILIATRCDEVRALLAAVDRALDHGLWAAGWIAYEAAPAFDPAFVTRPPGSGPLAIFGLFAAPEEVARLAGGGPPAAEAPRQDTAGRLAGEVQHSGATGPSAEEVARRVAVPPRASAAPRPHAERRSTDLEPQLWRAEIGAAAHAAAVAAIHHAIARGDTYQTNLTFRLRRPFTGDPWALFLALTASGQARHGGYLDLGGPIVASASPELLFRLAGEEIESRPMKGTAPRGRYAAEDEVLARRLAAAAKERAENLMIVDMVRHDLGRIARPGSVTVPRLFAVERYATLHQMTSTVAARTTAPLSEILAALFPPSSITGAPKASTMRLIAALEPSPRGVYTGALGWASPDRRAAFGVAIRTVAVDRESGRAECGIGSGIVWDSRAPREWRECRAKRLFLAGPPPAFRLVETLRLSPTRGLVRRDRHLDRLVESAAYFDFRSDRTRIAEELERVAAGARRRMAETADPPGTAGAARVAAPDGRPSLADASGTALGAAEVGAARARGRRVRLLLARDGTVEIETAPLPARHRPWRVALAGAPVDRRDPFLCHKTTRREIYDRARREHPEADDVLLWNRRRELTEATIANLALRLDGLWWTPPVACGLLAGTLRAALLERGWLRERRLSLSALDHAEGLVLFNSLRGLVPARLLR